MSRKGESSSKDCMPPYGSVFMTSNPLSNSMSNTLSNSMSNTLSKDVLMLLTQKTVQILSSKQGDLRMIKWSDGESNTDTGYSLLACACCKEAWDTIKTIKSPQYKDWTVECFIPDINLVFSNAGKPIATAKIELKSSKGGSVPGSTIGKLDINEPVIYCLRSDHRSDHRREGEYEFRYQQYHACMGESKYDLFQDRTPRPAVNFSKMVDGSVALSYVEKDKGHWVKHYADCALERLRSAKGGSWQDELVKNILDSFVSQTSVDEFANRKAKLLGQ